jgi:hypothetical protein
MMGNRIERYTYPSFVGAILLASALVVVGAPGPFAAAVLVVAGLIALVHARMGQLNRGNALTAGIGTFLVAAFVAVSDLFDNL